MGYDKKRISKASKAIMRAFFALKADDVLRDESNSFERTIAQLTKRIAKLRLSEGFIKILREANESIEYLESNCAVSTAYYLERMAEIGGRIFEKAFDTNDKNLYAIGSQIAAGMTAHDAIQDFKRDFSNRKFTPINSKKDLAIANEYINKFNMAADHFFPRYAKQTSSEEKCFWGTATGCVLVCGGLLFCGLVLFCCCGI